MSANQIPIPDSITELAGPSGGMVLVRNWRRGVRGPLWLMTLASLALLGYAVYGIKKSLAAEVIEWSGIIVIGGLMLTAGLLFVYVCIGMYINRTEFRVCDGELEIWNGPLPWRGNKTVKAKEMSALYVSERSWTDRYSRTFASYELRMLDRENCYRRLARGFHSAAEALFLEKRLEKLMKISTKHVGGGYKG